jgi:cysteinyl-tRNA synthetase
LQDLFLYNTLGRKVEKFIPVDKDEVKMYSCGPTVYSYAHIGNFRAYIFSDTLRRVLKYNGYNVNSVMNLTDVGHLASDADDGIDKLEKGAAREHKTVWEVAKFYSDYFLDGFHALNLLEPAKICRATDYVEQDMALVDKLTEKGFTYETADGVYFDTSKFPTYADFARLDLDHLRAGARVDFNSEKRNVSDFAVWKFIQPGEDHAMRWDYLGRPGYPGWHIECATIIHEELGDTIDIHTGGIDHIPVHHTNEIAQYESAYGTKMCNYWLHCNFITIEGQKISKSLGNTYTLEQLKEKGFEPLDFKLCVLQGHYRSERNFSFEDLTAAKNRRLRWRNDIARLMQRGINNNINEELQKQLVDAVSDDLNSAAAFSIIDSVDQDDDKMSIKDWEFVDKLFGLDLVKSVKPLSVALEQKIVNRESARAHKDWATSDQIRDELAADNIKVLDSANGPIWQYIK